jgi:sugar lactone lactonase YvrE
VSGSRIGYALFPALLLALLSALPLQAQKRRSVRHPTPPTTIVARLAGDGNAGHDDGATVSASFSTPRGIAVDRVSGAIYIADTGNHVIRRIAADSVVVFAGSASLRGSRDGTRTDARFALPHAIAAAADGSLFVADTGNHTIRKIDSGGMVTTIAGAAGVPGSADGAATTSSFRFPQGIAVANDGTIFVADTGNHTIRKISGGQVTTLAGLAGQSGGNNGSRTSARFNAPSGIAVAADGTLIVADAGNGAIRRVAADGSTTTLATGLQNPEGVAISSAGTIFTSDSCSHTILRIDGNAAVMFAGSAGSAGSIDGVPIVARFRFPRGMTFDSTNTLIVADSLNHLIRRITEVH